MIATARKYLGVPFVHKGRSMNGVDCVGIIYVSFNPILSIPDFRDYGEYVPSFASFMQIRNYAHRIIANEAGPGDVVLMCSGGDSAHYGIIAGATIIHADKLVGKVIEHGMIDKRIVAYFRMKGMPPWVKLAV